MSSYHGSPEDIETKMKSRLFRGYRAPLGVTQFEMAERIVSTVFDGENIVQLVQEVTMGGGERAIKTTNFTYSGDKITGTTISYVYDDVTP